MRTNFFVGLAILLSVSATAKADCITFPVCTAPTGQGRASIDGDIVVWEDSRDGWLTPNIYGKDLSTGQEFNVCKGTGTETNYSPSVSNNIVVWQYWPTGANYGKLYGKNLATGTTFPICNDGTTQGSPSISGNTVVWSESTSIYGYNLSTGTKFLVSTNGAVNDAPHISGDAVVWANNLGGISAKNISSGGEFSVYTGNSLGLGGYAISGNNIVFSAETSQGDFGIYGYNLSTSTEFLIHDDGKDYWPSISGNTVVWDNYSNGNGSIYGYDLLSHTEFPICTYPSSKRYPSISSNTIVWEDNRNGNYDIYGATITPEPSTIALLISGLIACGLFRCRRK